MVRLTARMSFHPSECDHQKGDIPCDPHGPKVCGHPPPGRRFGRTFGRSGFEVWPSRALGDLSDGVLCARRLLCSGLLGESGDSPVRQGVIPIASQSRSPSSLRALSAAEAAGGLRGRLEAP